MFPAPRQGSGLFCQAKIASTLVVSFSCRCWAFRFLVSVLSLPFPPKTSSVFHLHHPRAPTSFSSNSSISHLGFCGHRLLRLAVRRKARRQDVGRLQGMCVCAFFGPLVVIPFCRRKLQRRNSSITCPCFSPSSISPAPLLVMDGTTLGPPSPLGDQFLFLLSLPQLFGIGN